MSNPSLSLLADDLMKEPLSWASFAPHTERAMGGTPGLILQYASESQS